LHASGQLYAPACRACALECSIIRFVKRAGVCSVPLSLDHAHVARPVFAAVLQSLWALGPTHRLIRFDSRRSHARR
jgi:hypothetical protein